MIRFALLGVLALGGGAFGADLGRTDALWRDYLNETVTRGLPVLNPDGGRLSVPFWPGVDRDLVQANALEPGADVALLQAWIEVQQGENDVAAKDLRERWPGPALGRFSPGAWGQAMFAAWDGVADPPTWTDAWLGWADKVYYPGALARGIQVFEQTDPSAVPNLLGQALRLYPEDRRFLPLVARHPDLVNSPDGLLKRDLSLAGGWSPASLRGLLTRSPSVRPLLEKVGYSGAQLEGALAKDYASWLASDRKSPPGDGTWTWDPHQTGIADDFLTFQGGHLVSWTATSGGGVWSLDFSQGKPSTVTETRGGATWVLRYESYPWVRSLEYRWDQRVIVYRFSPLNQAVPLWPEERFHASVESLPPALADLWLPLDPRALASSAATVETWDQGLKTTTVFLYKGEVWMKIDDSHRLGRPDTWSYYRSGKLASVYHDVDGDGHLGLRELYSRGELSQVQAQAVPGPKAEFALFPREGVQLWDLGHQGRPLDRLFVWSGEDHLNALVFSGNTLPWETMPLWEPRP